MSSERDVGLDDHKDTDVAAMAEAGSKAAERQGHGLAMRRGSRRN